MEPQKSANTITEVEDSGKRAFEGLPDSGRGALAHMRETEAVRRELVRLKEKTQVCLRCGHRWVSRVSHPVRCPRCSATGWDRPSTTSAGRP